MELELEHKFLAHENEREEAKSHFLEAFGQGETKALRIIVGPYKGSSFEKKLEEYLNSKFDITDSSIIEKGLFFKKKTSQYKISSMVISEKTMSDLSNVFYDVILAFDVKVDVKTA